MTDLIEAYAAEVNRQIARQTEQPSDKWKTEYAKGVEIARRITKQRGYKVPEVGE